MSLVEGLLDLLKDVECSEKDNLVDGFVMEPTRKSYKILHEKKVICSVSFIDNDSNVSEDMKISQDNPGKYKVCLTEINDEEKTNIYKKKLTDLGFVEFSQD